MDERNIRTDKTTDVTPDVDIRRSMIMGRELDRFGRTDLLVAAPMQRELHWGPIWAGLAATLVVTFLLGALFVGVGFTPSAGAFGGLTPASVGWGTVIATIIGVFIGAYLTGYVSDMRTKAEAVYNGLMVGVMTVLTPLIAALFVANTAATAAANSVPRTAAPSATGRAIGNNVAATVPHSVTNALTVAANNAWAIFVGGVIVLALSAIAGYLGRRSREAAIAVATRNELTTRT
ncbi:MAG TPA: TIGR04086 family membrane protein [Oscillatoriaceae cyanobacterium]